MEKKRQINSFLKPVVQVGLLLLALQTTKLIWHGETWLNTRPSLSLMAIEIILILFFIWQKRFQVFPLLAILAAGISNFIDLVRLGGVADYFKFGRLWFNFEDLVIILSLIVIILDYARNNSDRRSSRN